MIKVAEYFESLEDGSIKCTLCPKMCILKDWEEGAYKVRVNYIQCHMAYLQHSLFSQ